MRRKIIYLSLLIATLTFTDYIKKDVVNSANKIFITTQSDIEKENEVKTTVYMLRAKEAKDLEKVLNGINKTKIVGVENKLILTGVDKEVEEIIEIIKKIDISKKQIMIKLSVIDTSKNLFERIGLKWKLNQNGPSSLLSMITSGKFSFLNLINNSSNFVDIDFEALKNNGDIVIKSVPSILVLDGEEGLIKLTNENLIKSRSKDKKEENIVREAGIILKAIPKLKDGFIEVRIKAEISNFKSQSSKKQNIIETVVNIKDGETIFLGGLDSYQKSSDKTKTPILGDIPILGALFTYKNKNNVKRDIYIELEAKVI